MKNKFTLIVAFTALASMPILAQTQSSAVSHKETILYNSNDTKEAPYRIPAIVTMSNGEILAISDYRPGGNDVGNGGEVDIYARISNDNGATWSGDDNTPHDNTSNIIKVADGTSSLAFGDAAVAAHPETGKVMVLCVGGNSTKFASATTSTSNYYTYMFSSSDYGRTWTSTNVTSTFKGSTSLLKNKKVCSMFFASGRLLVSKHTPGRVYGAILTREYNSGYANYNYVFYTDDFGQSWSMLGSDYAISGADEAKLEELPNGDILISSRTSGGRNFNIYSTSTQSWGTQQKVNFTDGNATNGELMIYRGVYKVGETTGATYDIMLQSLPTASNRAKVSVFYRPVENKQYSVSEIASDWVKGIEVYDGNSAYSAMTIMPNGEIGFLYEKDYYSSNSGDNYNKSCAKGGTANIVFLPLTVEEITGGVYTTTPPSTEPETPDTPDTPFEGKTFEVIAIEGKIGTQTYGMATFSATVPTMVPAGMTAYYVRKADESIITLSRISNNMAIPANEGVILMAGSAGDYEMTEVETGAVTEASMTGNLLVGTCDKESTTLKSTDYVLALKGNGTLAGQFAFCLVGDMTVTQPANRAYLQMEAGASLVRMMFDGNETSVDDVLETTQDEAIYYDLTGRRVAKPVSGSVYIQNGKKVVK